MYTKHDRQTARVRRHRRVRRRVNGTAARPRLCVHRSLRHISAQVIDDTLGTTLVAASTVEAELAERITGSRNSSAAAQVVGEALAGLVDNLTLAYPYASIVGYFQANMVEGVSDA